MPVASCQCGALTATVAAPSPAVVACHCRACQRRTGSAFGVGVYYPSNAVTTAGDSRSFTRATDAGGTFTSCFCPVCGSTVLWVAAKHPDLTGIALGAFADPAFAPPLRSVWEESRHSWVEIACTAEHFPRGRP